MGVVFDDMFQVERALFVRKLILLHHHSLAFLSLTLRRNLARVEIFLTPSGTITGFTTFNRSLGPISYASLNLGLLSASFRLGDPIIGIPRYRPPFIFDFGDFFFGFRLF